MVFVTLPAIIGLSHFVSSTLLDREIREVRLAFWTLTVWVCACLLKVGLSNPGLAPHYASPPPGEEGWPYSHQAKSYRRPKALYSRDCNAVIEGYDHTCPWTGTAIGAKNIGAFWLFVYSGYALFTVDVAAAAHGFLAPEGFNEVAGWAAALALLATAAGAAALSCHCLVRALSPEAAIVTDELDPRGYGAISARDPAGGEGASVV